MKSRTSAEEAARKKKDQKQKVIAYRASMSKILDKHLAKQYDSELIQMTTMILCINPDITTLWNIRRECLLKLQTDETPDNGNLFKKDLEFTEKCLLANPKSYYVWHHRCWILEHSTEPNWAREVEVCTAYLKLDERNCNLVNIFHSNNITKFVFLYFSSCLGLSTLCSGKG